MEEEKKPEEQPAEPEQPEQAPPPPEPTPPPEPAQPMPAEAQPVQPPAPEPAPPPPGPPPPSDTNTLIILGWVFIGLSVLSCCCCAWIFGPIAAILGGIAYSRGDQRGLPVLIVGIVVFLLGGGSLAFYRIYHWPPPWERFPGWHGHWRSA